MNVITITGRLVRDNQTGTAGQSGRPYLRNAVAVRRRFQRDGQPEADFLNIIAFGSTADFIAKYFAKGDMIAISGSVQTSRYTDKNGVQRDSFDIIVDNAEFCGGKNGNAGNGGTAHTATAQAPRPAAASKPAPATENFEEVGEEEDLPF